MIKVTVHEKQRVNEEQPTPASSPSHNHDSAAPRQHPLICTGAEPIHQVHGPPKPRATESMLRNRIPISAIFPPFYIYITYMLICNDWHSTWDTISCSRINRSQMLNGVEGGARLLSIWQVAGSLWNIVLTVFLAVPYITLSNWRHSATSIWRQI